MGRTPVLCAVLVAVAGLMYALSFVVFHDATRAPLWLMLDGALSTIVLVAIYERVRDGAPGAALWGLLMAVAGAIGAMIHGGYDLAAAISNAPAPAGDVISTVDPRGLLTFGASGVGLAVLVSRMRAAGFSAGLVALGYLSAGLSVVLYLARLIVIDPTRPAIVGPVLLEGFLVHPIWYLWLAAALRGPVGTPRPAMA